MMSEIIIYGQSDDLIEITGDVREELYANYNEPTEFRVGEWEIKAEYDGYWELGFLNLPENASCAYYSFGEHEKAPSYSATIVFETEEDDPEIEKL